MLRGQPSRERRRLRSARARRVPRTSAGARIGPWQCVQSSGSLLAEPICCRRVLQRRQRPDGIFVRRKRAQRIQCALARMHQLRWLSTRSDRELDRTRARPRDRRRSHQQARRDRRVLQMRPERSAHRLCTSLRPMHTRAIANGLCPRATIGIGHGTRTRQEHRPPRHRGSTLKPRRQTHRPRTKPSGERAERRAGLNADELKCVRCTFVHQ